MSEPYYSALARSDRTIGWEKVAALALIVGLVGQTVVLVERWQREIPHIDVAEVAELPAERLRNVTPDVMNAIGVARDIAERMMRIRVETIAEDQAWICNLMVPELAEEYSQKVPEIIGKAQDIAAQGIPGEVRAQVKSVTLVQPHLPFRVEVVVVLEHLGDYKPTGMGRPDPANPRKEEFRLQLTLVRTAKSHTNRDALLIREFSIATTK